MRRGCERYIMKVIYLPEGSTVAKVSLIVVGCTLIHRHLIANAQGAEPRIQGSIGSRGTALIEICGFIQKEN